MTEERMPYHEWQLSKACVVARRSRDPSTKCGAVIIRPDKTVAGEGYNGFPRRMEDKPEWYTDREKKYPRVIHSEMNALLHSYEKLDGYALYVTGPTCSECAKHVIAAGITAVFWPRQEEQDDFRKRWAKDMALALELYADGSVEVFEVEGETLFALVYFEEEETELDSMSDSVGIGMT